MFTGTSARRGPIKVTCHSRESGCRFTRLISGGVINATNEARGVIPAKAGIQQIRQCVRTRYWIPAFAGMTELLGFLLREEEAILLK